MRALALLLLVALPAAAQEFAGPRPLAVVEDATLRLGDIFEGAGPRAAQAIGASPAPGRRLVIEAAQLAALARAHGLAWRPLSAQERVVVERPGQALPREEIAAALRAELLRLGLDQDAELQLGPLAPPMVPPGTAPRLAAEGMTLDLSGRFGGTLVVMAEGMPVLRLRVAGRAVATLPVVVATRRLSLGEVVGPGDARLVRLRAEQVRPGTAERLDHVVGQQVQRPLGQETPFHRGDLASPTLVGKNVLVTMVVEAPGISLTAQGRALEAAPRGGLVPVMNLASRTVVEGEVTGPGRVRVAMGATPLRRGAE
ncbi:flagellar basal body P-ring formation chaperone FlgA [Dankookia sp. GCM10030260]|uniref:flagellar basal body P-ring formation chaperone FlgA n=1 Tax=Dankookia sp. GCM10030260 TaxID=3273390 RepID=UPI0036088941